LHVAMGASLGEAYRQAGYQSQGNRIYEKASQLAKLGKIRDRTEAIRVQRERASLATAIVTAQSVSAMLAEVFRNATADKQHGAAATAAMGMAKLHGLLIDKQEDVTRRASRDPRAPREMTIDGWLEDVQSQGLLGAPEPQGSKGKEPLELEPYQPDLFNEINGLDTGHDLGLGGAPGAGGSNPEVAPAPRSGAPSLREKSEGPDPLNSNAEPLLPEPHTADIIALPLPFPTPSTRTK